MKEVAETRTNRSVISPVSITRKSRTGSPGLGKRRWPINKTVKGIISKTPSPECDEESKCVCRQERLKEWCIESSDVVLVYSAK